MGIKLKISKVIDENGKADYKGLDIQKFVPGSQNYKMDNSFCVLETNEEDIISHLDIEVINKEKYVTLTDEINKEISKYTSDDDMRMNDIEDALSDIIGGVVNGSI